MSRKSHSLLFLFCVSILITGKLVAQSGVGNEEVIVVKEFEATIRDAEKVSMAPGIPEVEEVKNSFDYTVPSKDYKDFSFEPNPLKPISISKEKWEKFNTSYIKIGFGSQLMPIAELAYNDSKTKNLKFGIFYNHLSAAAYKDKLQRFSDDEVGAYLKYFPKAFEVGTSFTFRNYRTHYYGIGTDTLFSDTVFRAADVRQVFRNYDAVINFRTTQKNKAGIEVDHHFRFNYLQETFGKANEWYVAGGPDFRKAIMKAHAVTAHFDFDVSRLKNDSLVLQRNIFRLQLGYAFDNDDWEVKAKIGVAIDGKKAFPIADVLVEKRLFQHSLIAYTSYELLYTKNSLNGFATTNNFLRNYVDIKNSQAGNFGAGIKGTIQNFNYNVAFHLHHINNLPLFINDTTDMRRFVVVYDSNAIIYNFHLESSYNIKEWLRLSLLGDYNIFTLKNTAKPWHEPAVRVTLRANYIWKRKVSLTLDLYGVTNSVARLKDGSQVKVKGTADLNIGISYLMNKWLTFFGGVNNIAHIRYQRWYGYSSFGINGMVGARFSF